MAYRAGYFRFYYAPSGTSNSGGSTIVYLGETKRGIRWGTAIHRQIIQSDRGGESAVDGVEKGGTVTLSIEWIEYDKVKLAMKSINGASAYDSYNPYTNVGKLTTQKCGPIYCVPLTGTPSATEISDQCYRFFLAAPAGNFEDLLSSSLREGPLSFQCFPDPNNSEKIWDIVAVPGSASNSQTEP